MISSSPTTNTGKSSTVADPTVTRHTNKFGDTLDLIPTTNARSRSKSITNVPVTDVVTKNDEKTGKTNPSASANTPAVKTLIQYDKPEIATSKDPIPSMFLPFQIESIDLVRDQFPPEVSRARGYPALTHYLSFDAVRCGNYASLLDLNPDNTANSARILEAWQYGFTDAAKVRKDTIHTIMDLYPDSYYLEWWRDALSDWTLPVINIKKPDAHVAGVKAWEAIIDMIQKEWYTGFWKWNLDVHRRAKFSAAADNANEPTNISSPLPSRGGKPNEIYNKAKQNLEPNSTTQRRKSVNLLPDYHGNSYGSNLGAAPQFTPPNFKTPKQASYVNRSTKLSTDDYEYNHKEDFTIFQSMHLAMVLENWPFVVFESLCRALAANRGLTGDGYLKIRMLLAYCYAAGEQSWQTDWAKTLSIKSQKIPVLTKDPTPRPHIGVWHRLRTSVRIEEIHHALTFLYLYYKPTTLPSLYDYMLFRTLNVLQSNFAQTLEMIMYVYVDRGVKDLVDLLYVQTLKESFESDTPRGINKFHFLPESYASVFQNLADCMNQALKNSMDRKKEENLFATLRGKQ